MRLTLLFLFISLCSFSFSQISTKIIGGPNTEKVEALIECSNSDVVIGGTTTSFGSGGEDIILTRLSNTGTVIWSKAYGLPGNENGTPMGLFEAANGDILCSFRTYSLSRTRASIVMRLNSLGDVIWQKQIGDPVGDIDATRDIFEHDDGSIYLGASVNSSTFGSTDGLALKLDPTGNIIWSKIIGQGLNDHIWSILALPNNEILLNFNSESIGPGLRGVSLVRMNSTGNILSEYSFGGANIELASDVVFDPNIGYIVTGKTNSFGQGGDDAFIAKLDTNFNMIWFKTYGGTGYDFGVTTEIVNPNHYILYMNSEITSLNDKQMSVIGIDSNGVTLYTKSIGDEFDQEVLHASTKSLVYSQNQNKTFLTCNFNNSANNQNILFLAINGTPDLLCSDDVISESFHTLSTTPTTFQIDSLIFSTNVNMTTTIITNLIEQDYCPCPFNPPSITDTTICPSATLQYNLDPINNYEWLPASDFSCNTCPDPTFTGNSTTQVTLNIDNGYCFDTLNFTITVQDTIPPSATAPADIFAQCASDVPTADINEITNVSDNCSANPIITHLGDVSDGNSCPETITRTYNVADEEGNSIDLIQTIIIHDTIAPTGTAPADLSLQCITDIPVPNIASITNVTDNCTTNPTITWVNDFSDTSSCPKVIIRTYNIADDCGNNIDVTQTITVNDDIAPTASNPVALSLQCIGDAPIPNISAVTDAADNCTTSPAVSFISDVSNGNSCPEIITRTYRITDDCGNFTDVTQTITINDDILPTGTAPTDLNIQCIADLPAADVNSITDEADNCTTNPIVTHVSDVSDGNTCPEIVTRTYNIADDCGNNIDVVQTITINDDTNPTGTAPANITVQCIGDVPAADVNLITDEADNCTANPTVTFVSDVSDGASCPETITRTYNIADDCGNNIDVVQTITVNDDIAPTASNPTPISVQCIGDVPTPDILVVTDEADNCTTNPTVTFVGDVSNGNTCPEIITRTYRITDDCGNFTDVNQTITISDDTNPTGTAPADLTVQCIGDVPTADVNLITDEGDNCTANPTVTFVGDVSNGATCPEIITRTYNIADDCGNDINLTQTITINDDILPTASNVSTTVQCLTDVPAVDIAVITDEADNCTANPTIAFVSENSDGNSCNGEIITRVYSVTDDCGNSINVNHTILVDSYTPTFTVSGTGTTTCEGTDGMITISGLDPNTNYEMSYDGGATNSITTNAAGEYVITGLPAGSYTNYTVSDADCPSCTNTENVSININDPTAAYINAGPDQIVCEGTTITLNADNPEGANLSWDNGVTDGVGFVPPNGITYYTITAERVNCYSSDQLMVTVSPAITDITCPADLEAICDITEQPPYANFNAFIAVGGSATIPTGGIIDSTSFAFVSDVSDGLTCPETITRTYQIADTCGVIVTCTQDIVINDTIKPTGTAPAPVALQCITDLPAADVTLITDEADNCTANPTVIFVSDVSDGNTCPEIITRTYNIEDDCGNSIDVTQEFTINDDINPTGTAPASIAVQCIGDVPLPDSTLITDEADNCTTIPTVTFVSDVSDGNTCPETITRTYNIADDCGNNIDVTQLITIDDDIVPTASDATPTTVQCNSDVSAVDIAVITDEADNCTVNPTVAFVSESSDGNLCNGEIITRIYSVTDDCGNSINVNHVITIDSYTPPTTIVASTTGPTTCGGTDGTITLSGFDPLTDYEISFDGGQAVPFTSDAAGEYIITGLAEGTYVDYTIIDDQCNVCTTTETVTITLTDPAPPIIGAGPDVEVCEGDIVILTANNPDGAVITWDNGVTDGVGFIQAVGTMTYTVTGTSILNCTATDEVDVTVHPNPVVDFFANVTEGCVGDEINITSLTPGVGNTCRFTINGNQTIDGCNINYAFNESGCYDINLEVESDKGCTADLTKDNYICIDDYPIADFSVTPEELSTFYNEAEFTNESSGAVTYDWDFGDSSFSNEINPTHVYSVYNNDPKVVYNVQLIAYSELGCADTIIGELPYFEDLIYYVPNSFTPDGNKYNETFKPVFTSGFDPLDYKLEIYNRWGEMIFESNDPAYGWDGTYGAKNTIFVPEGTYVWKISFKKLRTDENMEEMGSVNLLR
ncbi:HYR-like domain-containing protein [Brumimicrobium oceani]|uniref:PKD domain-containing protein n=1 Tax=Brumimicrobium oceani TaxID=2100725 RepID=A0A2U2XGD2_9FLAO|nr:gliding motility-associated C-terminal domain-containing protein [Brumimicrobium oceani]PWH86869.1 hypothetical protein DIT68_01010 [Brumimicrobium oceani]